MSAQRHVATAGCAFLLALGPGSAALASPTVDGTRIGWPDDGWYQVLDATTFAEICGGTRSCDVAPGDYLVINHSTGERFPIVSVTDDRVAPAGVTVDGSRIAWPDDGWYQVQDASTFAEICGGTRFCDVAPGEYLVVNHSTGERFPLVTVTGDGRAPNGVTVDGNRIAWPDDGWYQVQDATTFTEICGGTRFCDVPAGEYIVINHSSGTRDVVSVDGDASEPGTDGFITAANALDVLAESVAVINTDQVDAFFEGLARDLNVRDTLFFLSNTVDDIAFSETIPADPPYRVQVSDDNVELVGTYGVYTCAAGGRILSAGFGNASDAIFNGCAVNNATYSGTTGIRDLARGTIGRQPYDSFTRRDADGRVRTLDGERFSGNLSFVVRNARAGWRDLSFTDTQGNVNVSDHTMAETANDSSGAIARNGGFFENDVFVPTEQYAMTNTIEGGSTLRSPFTNGNPLRIEVNLAFEDRVNLVIGDTTRDFPGRDDVEPFAWQTGQMRVVAADGSGMTVRPSSGDAFTIELDGGDTLGPFPWTGVYEIDRL